MAFQLTQRRTRSRSRFPNAIREYRVARSLSQRALGTLVGRSRSMVSAWERGHYLPSLASVFRLARALDTLAESLYWGLYRPSKDGDSETKQQS